MRVANHVHHVFLFLWRCFFVCLIAEIRSGAFVLPSRGVASGGRCWYCDETPLATFYGSIRMVSFSPPRKLALYNMADSSSSSENEDDDDISQHTIMIDDDDNTNATTTLTMAKGYRPIESWHQENRNPTHVLDHLKREQAHWKGKFEDLGGDGI
uniref:Uncharacterized protein n=1 Tax=Amphora coffeiformis TaxID=265554 RepID=A0A7S3L6F2_9STRA|mmetsp:Transcript_24054/g.45709  ORF Transcript_24054/g.45709 Transcript_24054/m.45709 type:complete len:155 (+) Transcript_24054:90-554(+)|eukprot:scaffold25307_cov168-Amphora_coffeaeformis.AAC.10